MIKLDNLHIEEFRGIRELDIDFNYNSFVVHGPNGSGKSGVVDAIGFALTGTVARLKGAGTGSVSLKAHAPHVKSKDDPEAARVSLTFKDTVSGQVGTITRTVQDSANYNLAPDTPELRAALEEALLHPEFTLSRREIIRFILAEPTKRSEEVQVLLQLDKLGINRKALRSTLSKVDSDKKNASTTVAVAQQSVTVHLALDQFNADTVKTAVNLHRKILGLDEFSKVDLSTDLKQGLDEGTEEKIFDKASALREVKAYEVIVYETSSIEEATTQLINSSKDLAKGTDLNLLKHRSFFETGLELIANEGVCPLCDTTWHTPEELRNHLNEKIEGSKELARIDSDISLKTSQLKTALSEERSALNAVHALSVVWSSLEEQVVFQTRLDLLVEIETLLKDSQTAITLWQRLEAGALNYGDDLKLALENLKTKVSTQPDTSEKSKSRNHLIIAAERWENFGKAKANEVKMNEAATRAKIVYDAYSLAADSKLEDLYSSVEKRFSTFYSKINQDDEKNFKAELKPSAGKLDLLVDFYGLGMYPPGAYHSEGHQDGMGICLYLALVEKILGKNFTLSVLDDVVMSVDVNHRRQFCELLKDEFPETQFIITTHDEIWAKQMQTTGLIKSKSDIRFRDWSVDNGPIYEQGQVFWDKIEEDLKNNDVPSAAHKLRRGLEAELPDIAESIGARVMYRGDARYELGELMDAVKGRHGDLLKKAGASAVSWGNKTQEALVTQLKKSRADAMLSQDKEQWAVNLQVHYNDWGAMQPADFRPVVSAWQEFLKLFTCSNTECQTWIGVRTQGNHEETLRCRCGDYNLNLLKKN